jgi:murein DD-endopeptidase MepM/ murein hydrolase activator NlpD
VPLSEINAQYQSEKLVTLPVSQSPCTLTTPDSTTFPGSVQPVFPVTGRVGRAFENHGKQYGSSTRAVDWAATPGNAVVSILDGEVIETRAASGTDQCGGMVRIKYKVNNKDLVITHCHLSVIPSDSTPFPVSRGQTVGVSGGEPGQKGAGRTTGAHLHTEYSIDGKSATNDDIKELLGWDLLDANNRGNVLVTNNTSCAPPTT